MASRYSLTIVNNSDQTGDFCLYQIDPNIRDPYIMSLAWFSKGAHPTTTLVYEWSLDYNFTWADTGPLVPGVVFKPSEIINGGLITNNMVTFTQEDGTPHFKDLVTNPAFEGLQHIECDETISRNTTSIGVGMSGAPTFARQSEPNMGFSFSQKIQYRLTFGYYQQGEVLNLDQITHYAIIEFPPNVFSMTAIFNADNTWTIEPN